MNKKLLVAIKLFVWYLVTIFGALFIIIASGYELENAEMFLENNKHGLVLGAFAMVMSGYLREMFPDFLRKKTVGEKK